MSSQEWEQVLRESVDETPRVRRTARQYRRELKQQAIERVRIGEWKGHFLASGQPLEWSPASKVRIAVEDWQREWPRLAAMIHADQLDVIKRDASGDVLAASATLGGVAVDIIIKRPKNKSWHQYVVDVLRPSRARRAWTKTRWLLARGVPVERPLAIFGRRAGEFAVESVAVFERVAGDTLEHVDLDALTPADRETFFRRCGRALRLIDDTGLAHTDAKSSNWIVFRSPTDGAIPVAIDAYGIRRMNPWLHLFGLHRLLRAMKKHPQYTPTDSLHLCQGFAPESPLTQENEVAAEGEEADDAN